MQNIKKFIKNNFKNIDIDALYAPVLNDPYVKKFITENHLTQQEINKAKPTFFKYYTAKYDKENTKILAGYEPILFYQNYQVGLSFRKSQQKLAEEKKQKQLANVDLINLPSTLKSASFHDIFHDKAREKIITYIKGVYFAYKQQKDSYPKRPIELNHQMLKGCYLCGNYGVGKTYLMAVLANNLAGLGAKVCFMHMPTFVAELNGFIAQKKDVNKLIYKICVSDVLILDDIGAERLSDWSRDNVLGVILQYRMDNRMLTFFTSNLDLEALQNSLEETNQGISKIKAERLMQRIRFLSEEFPLIDEDADGKSKNFRFKQDYDDLY